MWQQAVCRTLIVLAIASIFFLAVNGERVYMYRNVSSVEDFFKPRIVMCVGPRALELFNLTS